ncbi:MULTISPECIES: vanadium-dependent haloperoxidase [unclassified Actinomadura]|uniref:vanadium-dependent haloperoxidase n=1 Tax=unclassified Actinomadura TaxID=2626254 RepID=UPI0011EE918A|nr:vanadium-dependent haloperoxidase [Actinomadura sp. K4S16]
MADYSDRHFRPDTGPFDFERGNAAVEVIFPALQAESRLGVSESGSDASLVADFTMALEVTWFDAVAPYYYPAKGIYSDLGHRPKSECNNRNKNVAVLYASYRILNDRLPHGRDDWRKMMESVGLNPDDDSEDKETPAGIGNLAARGMIEARADDGMNRLGYEGRKYHPQPYRDYTGFQPVNTAFELHDPSHWQPNVNPYGNGVFTVQHAVTPQMRLATPFTFSDPSKFKLEPPVNSDVRNIEAYRKQADEVLAASAGLTDRQKVLAELFNDKFFTLGVIAGTTALRTKPMEIGEFVQYLATVEVAIFDAAIVDWHYKALYHSVRPFSAIRYLYGDKPVTAWGGPGKGTVHDITGNEWQSYLTTPDHPEYPSVSTSLCGAYTQAARLLLGGDEINSEIHVKAGSSVVEPGITPVEDMTLSWDTWTDLSADCGMSRHWGGVHFRSAISNVSEFATQIGTRAYEFMQEHLEP